MRSAWLLLVLALPVPADAQGILLRYRPPLGARLQSIADTRVTTTVVGFPSVPDSTIIETTWRTVSTQRVLSSQGAMRTVIAAFDSSRARARVGTGARDDVATPGVEGLQARWIVNDRLEASARSGGGAADSAFLDALTATTGGFAFWLPDTLVDIGGEWTALFRFPLGAHLTAGGKIIAGGSIGGRGTAVLDSLVPRGRDTLAYITVRAVANPTPMAVSAEGGVGTGTFNGGFAAALVWSTGWNAVVSGATNGRVTGTISITRPDGAPVNAALTLVIAGRHQVRL